MVELRGEIGVQTRRDGQERYVYWCPVCGFHSRQFGDRAGAAVVGLDHEERTRCATYRAERLPY